MKEIIEKSLQEAISYSAYRTLVSDLLADGKSTGNEQSEALTNYSMLNDRRMKRLDKTIKLSDETIATITNVAEAQTWLVLTEGWCGDAAQNLPIINKIASLNEKIKLKIILRDNNLELMDLFLTNGGRSIPKLIVLDKNNNAIKNWGPRPTTAAKMVTTYKAAHGTLTSDFKQDLQVWYNKDKGLDIQRDFIDIVKSTTSKASF